MWVTRSNGLVRADDRAVHGDHAQSRVLRGTLGFIVVGEQCKLCAAIGDDMLEDRTARRALQRFHVVRHEQFDFGSI